MEFNITILDTFPSLNKLLKQNNLLLELNNKEYNLKKIIIQQDIISIKENITEIKLKVYILSDDKKVLIGENQINLELFNSENKCSIFWLEFKKKIEENKKDINDINLLFYDCIRLKIKLLPIKIILKTDKKIKANKSKLKFCSPNEQRKNKNNNDLKDSINLANSYRVVNENNCLLKSNSLKENIRLTKINIDENNVKLTENKTNVIIDKSKIKNIMEKYKNLEIDPEKSISENIKDLKLENEVILTDNNILENYSFSTSQGDNNKNNIINVSNTKKAEIKKNNTKTIKANNNSINCEFQKSLVSQSNFNNIIKSIIFKSNEENKNSNMKKDISLSNINIIKENEKYNNSNTNTIKKLKNNHKKTKSFNKIIYKNDINNVKHNKNYNINKINIKNKINGLNINKSVSKDNLLHNCYTLNDFHNSKIFKNSINYNQKETEINKSKEKGLKERQMTTGNIIKNNYLNELLISKNKDKKNNTIEEADIYSEENKDEKSNMDDFFSLKKDYELFYTLKFIENIKTDLLDLEFNIALDKSICLFKLYNKKVNSFYKTRNNLINIIKNYTYKIKQIHKKTDLMNYIRRKNELNEKNKLLIKRSTISFSNEILSQKKILQNLIMEKINKRVQLKSIVEPLLKKQTIIQGTLDKNKKNDNEEKELKKKLFNQTPNKKVNKVQNKWKKAKDISKKKELNLSENKNKNKIKNNSKIKINVRKVKDKNKGDIKKNKSIIKNLALATIIDKNLMKNNSINNLFNLENFNKRNNVWGENVINRESKSRDNNSNNHLIHKEITNSKNNNVHYSTARENFYNFNNGK